MIMLRVFVSSVIFMVDEDFWEDYLKLCFFWYDEVFIEIIGVYDEWCFFEGLLGVECIQVKLVYVLLDVIVFFDCCVSQDVIGDLMMCFGFGYLCWGKDYENYIYLDLENGVQYVYNMLLEYLVMECGLVWFNDGYDVQMVEGVVGIVVDVVFLWECVNVEMFCVL